MKAIVAGASGFVGRNVVGELIEQGHEVVALSRNCAEIPTEWKRSVTMLPVNLDDLDQLLAYPEVWGADVWYHFGWEATSGDGRGDYELQLKNVSRTCSAIRLAEQLGCQRFIHAGSIMEYEAMMYLTTEQCKPGKGYIYSTAKLCADFMAKTLSASIGMKYVNVIISNVFGPGERSARFLYTTLRKMLKDEPIALTEGRQMYDFIYISDAANKFVFLGENGEKNENYYLGNPTQKPLREYILEMAEVCGSKSQLMFGVVPFSGPYLDYDALDPGKMERMGIANQETFTTGITKTIEWMRNEK